MHLAFIKRKESAQLDIGFSLQASAIASCSSSRGIGVCLGEPSTPWPSMPLWTGLPSQTKKNVANVWSQDKHCNTSSMTLRIPTELADMRMSKTHVYLSLSLPDIDWQDVFNFSSNLISTYVVARRSWRSVACQIITNKILGYGHRISYGK
jgi:hypothetical protein